MADGSLVNQISKIKISTGRRGLPGVPGSPGESAYQIWLKAENTGTEEDFLNSLKGTDGSDGSSAYESWIRAGNIGTEEDFLNSLKGADGSDGSSAYESWIRAGNVGTEEEFLNSLIGPQGLQGHPGSPIPTFAIAYEAIQEGQWINIFSDNGVIKIRVANAALGYLADGYVLSNFNTNDNAICFRAGNNNKTNQCAAGEVYLSDANPGQSSSTFPAEKSGHWLQKIGKHDGNTTVFFEKGFELHLT